jgi:prophage tail gpP-like protein
MSVEIVSVPTPGKRYKIVKDDFLSKIAGIAYGDTSKWRKIWAANQSALKSGDEDLIYPGEIIFIPELAERKVSPKTLTGKAPDALTLVINDIEIPTADLKVTRTIDTAADGWTALIAWKPGKDEKIDEATKPWGYQNASIFLGNDLLVDGRLYKVRPSGTVSGRQKALTGFSFTKDAIDSNVKPPYEVKNLTLRQRANDLIEPFGILVVWEVDDDNYKFDKITASDSDKVVGHLQKYAKQRGVLVSSDVSGNLLFQTADTESKSVGTIEEGQQGFLKYEADFDGTKRFNSTKATGQSPGDGQKVEIAKDDNVPTSRTRTIKANDVTAGELKKAAEWERSKAVADALTIPFQAFGFFAPNGERWTENTIVTVKSEVISIEDGFDFLIKRVEFVKNASGKTTNLSLVPPQVYTGEEIPDIFK